MIKSFVFYSAKSLRTPSNIFVVNLAICDFIMMLKSPVFIYNSFHQGFAAGIQGCRIFGVMGSITGIGQALTNTCIAYDRFTTITRPFDGKITRTKALVMVLFVYIYALPWTLLPLFEIWGRFVPGNTIRILYFVEFLTLICRGILNYVHLRLFDQNFRYQAVCWINFHF